MLVFILLRDMKMQSTLTGLNTGGQGHLVILPQRSLGLNVLKPETNMLVTLTDNYDRHKLSDEDSWQPDEISFIKMRAVYY